MLKTTAAAGRYHRLKQNAPVLLFAARLGPRLVPKGILRQEGSCMSAATQLRVYYGPEQVASEESTTTIPLRDTVSLPLGEVLPLLMDAVKNRRQWVGDFFDDEIMISSDLYEVLLAYQHFRRPSA